MKVRPLREWSLRTRLIAIAVVVLAVALTVQGIVTYKTTSNHLLERIDRQLATLGTSAEQYAVTDFAPGEPVRFTGDDDDAYSFSEDIAQSGELASYAEIRDIQNVVTERYLIRRDRGTPRIPHDLGLGEDDVRYIEVESETDEDWRVRISRVPGNRGYLVLAQPLHEVEQTTEDLRKQGIAIGVVCLVVAWALCLWLIVRSLRPLATMGTTAAAIGAGDLSKRVEPANDRTEVGRLGAALNTMLVQLEAAFAKSEESHAQLRRFVADASHELRTPLTSIRGYAEMFSRGAAENPADLATVMRRIESESARMAGLVDELLLLARFDEGQVEPQLSLVDLVDVLTDAAADLRAISPQSVVRVEAAGPVVVRCDEERIRQVVANLVANARVHTPPGTPITLSVAMNDGVARVSVADAGPGMSADVAEHVFERFYRSDASRTRASGGAGLGLSIVAAVLSAHGAKYGVVTAPGAGATFWFELSQ